MGCKKVFYEGFEPRYPLKILYNFATEPPVQCPDSCLWPPYWAKFCLDNPCRPRSKIGLFCPDFTLAIFEISSKSVRIGKQDPLPLSGVLHLSLSVKPSGCPGSSQHNLRRLLSFPHVQWKEFARWDIYHWSMCVHYMLQYLALLRDMLCSRKATKIPPQIDPYCLHCLLHLRLRT
jgi:hypothetical protein